MFQLSGMTVTIIPQHQYTRVSHATLLIESGANSSWGTFRCTTV